MDSIFIQDRTQSLDLEHAQIQPHSLACWFCVEVKFTIPKYDLHGVADEQKYARPHTKHMCPSKLSLYAIILVSDIWGGVISLNVIDLFTSPQFLSRTRHQLANPPPPPPPPTILFLFFLLLNLYPHVSRRRKQKRCRQIRMTWQWRHSMIGAKSESPKCILRRHNSRSSVATVRLQESLP